MTPELEEWRQKRWNLSVFLVVLQLADVITTWHGLSGGEHREANPVGVALLSVGVGGLLVGKAAATGAVVAMTGWVAKSGERGQRLSLRGLRWSCWLMLVVVGWNSFRVA